ncbi:DEAD/DEAH box helicase family protein [Cellulosilyticum sp. ST5]|uniref:DEAD/DEAH box helicase n=1 Tax=Cellulosilyticum sp. ST5 TaxID=3055805 RepID=UPI00397792D1
MRDYQRHAIDTIEKYLSSDSQKQALIKMPTGTGKTGVIAVASHMSMGNILIIVPNAILPEQIKYEIEDAFWEKINCNNITNKKDIKIIKEDDTLEYIEHINMQILIITIQRLLILSKEKKTNSFSRLVQCTKAIFFDEGHRELAEIWAIVIKEFKCKKVLFTATPYRNDKALFNIDEQFVYRYSIQEALHDKSICNIKFEKLHTRLREKNTIDELIDFIINLVDKQDKRILIRMENKYSIETMVKKINEKINNIAAGFHSECSKSPNLFNKGQEIYAIKNQYNVFIHSDMLIEGLDFCELDTLIILDSFYNSRSFIQQIGRVLRNNEEKKQAIVFLWENEYEKWLEQWELYIRNDSQDQNVEYIEGFFRERFLFEEDFYKEVKIPKKANIFTTDKSVFNEVKNRITDKITGKVDLTYKVDYEERKREYLFWIMCYEKRMPSKFFDFKYYEDKSLQMVVLLEVKKNNKYFIFYQDTSNFSVPISELDIIQVAAEDFYKLIPDEFEIQNTRYTQTMQRRIGPHTQDITGFKLNSVPNNTNERMSFCRNVSGVMRGEKTVKRYVSPIKATISDKESGTYMDYVDWARKIVGIWITKSRSNLYFDRYSKIVAPPTSLPTSILLEIDKNIKDRKTGREFYLESSCIQINSNKQFTMIINHEPYICNIGNLRTNKISVNTPFKNRYEVVENKEKNILLETYLNKGNFRLYYREKNIMYNDKVHFSPNITTYYSKAEEWSMWKSIQVIDELATCKDEKLGDKTITTTWPPQSTFNVIINEIEKNYPYIKYIVCDDQNEEMADFIALSVEKEKCYFIHCKQKKKSLSASDFQDVCGQAIKNIQYIITSNWSDLEHIDKHISRWKTTWKYTHTPKKGREITWNINRLVKAPKIEDNNGIIRYGTIDDFVEQFKKINTSYQGEKEVWIVQGGLSKQGLKKEIERVKSSTKQKEQVTQLIWYLQSTQDIIINAGGKLKIVCQP